MLLSLMPGSSVFHVEPPAAITKCGAWHTEPPSAMADPNWALCVHAESSSHAFLAALKWLGDSEAVTRGNALKVPLSITG